MNWWRSVPNVLCLIFGHTWARRGGKLTYDKRGGAAVFDLRTCLRCKRRQQFDGYRWKDIP
jgi:hypothetical protein